MNVVKISHRMEDRHENGPACSRHERRGDKPPMTPRPPALFRLGRIVATPGCLEALVEADPLVYLHRHAEGDWGDLDDFDKRANDAAVRNGERILSAYTLPDGTKVWIITEADRTVTTLLLPEEY